MQHLQHMERNRPGRWNMINWKNTNSWCSVCHCFLLSKNYNTFDNAPSTWSLVKFHIKVYHLAFPTKNLSVTFRLRINPSLFLSPISGVFRLFSSPFKFSLFSSLLLALFFEKFHSKPKLFFFNHCTAGRSSHPIFIWLFYDLFDVNLRFNP